MKRIPEPEIMIDRDQCIDYFNHPHEFVFNEVLNLIPKDSTGTACDLGCGPGMFTNLLRNRCPGLEIDAYDGSPVMLEIARTYISDLERINLINQKIENIDKNYDLIVSLNTLHHIHKPEEFWNTIDRISTPTSKIIVLDLVRPDSLESVDQIISHVFGKESPDSWYKTDFLNSLKAAFTKEEVEDQISSLGYSFTLLTHLSIRDDFNLFLVKNF